MDAREPGSDRTAGRRCSAVILAAGLSRRMAPRHKLLLPLADGEPMIRRVARMVLATRPAQTIVVAGACAEEIIEALTGLDLDLIVNPQFEEEGQPGSLRRGFGALSAPCDAAYVMLGDQPRIEAPMIERLLDHFFAQPQPSILAPRHGGRPGHPVIFAARHIEAIAAGRLRLGNHALSRLPGVAFLDLEEDAYVEDCDTPQDYERLLSRMSPT